MKKTETLDKKVEAVSKHRAKASINDILGGRSTKPKVRVDPKWRDLYHELLVYRERLAGRREGLVKEAAEELPAFSLHMADAGTDTFDRDFALSMASSEQSLLYEIEQAIQRVESGSYGVCEITGKRIETERLKAIPWTRYSTEAEKELEKEGVTHRARLAPLQQLPMISTAEPTEEEGEEEEAVTPR